MGLKVLSLGAINVVTSLALARRFSLCITAAIHVKVSANLYAVGGRRLGVGSAEGLLSIGNSLCDLQDSPPAT